MKIHHYHYDTGEFLGGTDARLDPLEIKAGNSIYLIPAYATTDPPPECGPNEIAVWGAEGWSKVQDFRETEAWYPNGEPVVVRNLGPLPETLVYEAPPAEFRKPEWDGSAWVETYVEEPSPLLAELEAATSDQRQLEFPPDDN
jgi:hypothetical protein